MVPFSQLVTFSTILYDLHESYNNDFKFSLGLTFECTVPKLVSPLYKKKKKELPYSGIFGEVFNVVVWRIG